jgi:galactokinase
VDALHAAFRDAYPSAPSPRLFRAPGRVNLIGEHTDYNDGYVLPAAIDRDTLIAIAPRTDTTLHITSLNLGRSATNRLDDLQPLQGRDRWSNYCWGVALMLARDGFRIPGADMAVFSNVPIAAGLSSSAALEVATGYALLSLRGQGDLASDAGRKQLALRCQRAENQFVGVNCGIMDQAISALGRARHALFLDCRTLDTRLVPIASDDCAIVLADTRVGRGLASSQYNVRRSQCEEGVRMLKQVLPSIRALRDVTPEDFARHQARLPDVVRARCRHVVTENARVLSGISALAKGALDRFGALMFESHESLRDDYDVSCTELDLLVAAAREVDGVFGSRMTGAGFGGCTVSVVRTSAVDTFARHLHHTYRAKTGTTPRVYVTNASDGASPVEL